MINLFRTYAYMNGLKLVDDKTANQDGYNEFGKIGDVVEISDVVVVSSEPMSWGWNGKSTIMYDLNGINFSEVDAGKVSFQKGGHYSDEMIGGAMPMSGKVNADKATVSVQIGNYGDGINFLRNIKNGFGNATSIGYTIDKSRIEIHYDDNGDYVNETYYADAITILEISSVAIPRDPMAYINSDENQVYFNSVFQKNNEGKKMAETNTENKDVNKSAIPAVAKPAVAEMVANAEKDLRASLSKNSVQIDADANTRLAEIVENHSKSEKFSETSFAIDCMNAVNAGQSAIVSELQKAIDNNSNEIEAMKELQSKVDANEQILVGMNTAKAKRHNNARFEKEIDFRKKSNTLEAGAMLNAFTESALAKKHNGMFDEHRTEMNGLIDTSLNINSNSGMVIPLEAYVYRSALLSGNKKLLQNAFSVTGDTGTKGGVLVDIETLYGMWEDQLFITLAKQMLGVTQIMGLSSNIAIPQMGAKLTAYFLGESATVSPTDAVITAVTSSPKRLSAQVEITRLLNIMTNGFSNIAVLNSLMNSVEEKHVVEIVQGDGTGSNLSGITVESGITNFIFALRNVQTPLPWAEVQEFLATPLKQNVMMQGQRVLAHTDFVTDAKITARTGTGSDRFVMEDRNMIDGYEVVSTNAFPTYSAGNDMAVVGDFGSIIDVGFGTDTVIIDDVTKANQDVRVATVSSYKDLMYANKNKIVVGNRANA